MGWVKMQPLSRSKPLPPNTSPHNPSFSDLLRFAELSATRCGAQLAWVAFRREIGATLGGQVHVRGLVLLQGNWWWWGAGAGAAAAAAVGGFQGDRLATQRVT